MPTFKKWMFWLLLAGNFCFPAIAAAVGWLCSKGPEFNFLDVDWDGASPPARALNALLLLQVLYVPVTVVLSRRRRVAALLVGLSVLGISVVVNFCAYLAVTHIYI